MQSERHPQLTIHLTNTTQNKKKNENQMKTTYMKTVTSIIMRSMMKFLNDLVIYKNKLVLRLSTNLAIL